MRAAVFEGVGRPLVVEDVEPLPPGPHDAVVQVLGSGVCHTEVAVLHGHLPFIAPAILGHEVAGIVLETGPAVTRVRPGDTVIAAGIPACGNCWFCIHGQSYLCELNKETVRRQRAKRAHGEPLVAFASLGGFAEAIIVDEASIVPVRSDLPAEQLALIGCAVMTGVGAALNTAAVAPGSTVTVIGCGGVGQCVIQGARIAGAAEIIAVDPVPLKRVSAKAQGATGLIDPAEADTTEQVLALTEGRGTDYTFEVVGRPETISTSYGATRRGGIVTIVGMPPVDSVISMPGLELFLGAKEIRVSNAGSGQIRRDFPRLVALAEAGRLDLASMISRRITLDDVDDALHAIDRGEVIRSVVVA